MLFLTPCLTDQSSKRLKKLPNVNVQSRSCRHTQNILRINETQLRRKFKNAKAEIKKKHHSYKKKRVLSWTKCRHHNAIRVERAIVKIYYILRVLKLLIILL